MLSDEIAKIEYISEVRKKTNWYYHGLTSSPNVILKIVQQGLLSKCLSMYSRTHNGYNGRYYISLSKDVGADFPDSAYSNYIDKYPLLIIDNIIAFKCFKIVGCGIFTNTILPFRTSGYVDEYQAFKKVEPSKFVGIEAKAYEWAKLQNIKELKKIRDIILLMRKTDIYFPIYDYSRVEEEVIHEIDQEKYLFFSKKYLS